MVFREFNEDDLDSYLEGSVWSEKPSAAEIFSDRPDQVITVFPSTSHINMAYGYPPKSCETTFASRRIPSVYQNEPPREYNSYSRRNEYIQPKPVSPFERSISSLNRPGSPGPVAGAGEIINTEHGFTIELDVFRFRPEEIKVVLTDDLLSITGERFEYAGDGQTLRRSFSRKYSIPEDIHLDSIRSHLTDSGILVVNGSRRGWKETNVIFHGPRQSYYSGNSYKNVISTV
ncbi:unnamed protein product [Caenorhabditis bovis]|uniref:SHSP domain-containing protein n=1 Tax=Caenorhabditis bovis TaxID=2654633 RepID=A0A8S1ET25_9PELO|nr:unnamed protein product [Caenorhabditis bovis]